MSKNKLNDDVFYQRALDWMVMDEYGNQEKPIRFLRKALITGYREKQPDGSTRIYKLTLKWFKKNTTPEQWKDLKIYIGKYLVIYMASVAVMQAVHNSVHVNNENWEPEMTEAVNIIFSAIIAKFYFDAASAVVFYETKIGKGGEAYDDRTEETS